MKNKKKLSLSTIVIIILSVVIIGSLIFLSVRSEPLFSPSSAQKSLQGSSGIQKPIYPNIQTLPNGSRSFADCSIRCWRELIRAIDVCDNLHNICLSWCGSIPSCDEDPECEQRVRDCQDRCDTNYNTCGSNAWNRWATCLTGCPGNPR